MDGEVLARTIRQDARLQRTALVMLTSGGQRPAPARMADAGLAGHIVKPLVRPTQLLELILRAAATKAVAPDPRVAPPVPDTVAPARARGRSSDGHKRRVLLAEDNPVNQRLASHALGKLDCVVDVAANGREAVEMARQLPYDCVFMDCQMPELDGLQATARIRALPGEAGRVPVIALTAHAMAGDRERCLAAGMDDYVTKPMRQEDLREALERWAPARVPVGDA
jgi:CheY-like chemotaxis protein